MFTVVAEIDLIRSWVSEAAWINRSQRRSRMPSARMVLTVSSALMASTNMAWRSEPSACMVAMRSPISL